jgi:serine/threonine-protein kinase RsbW
MASNAALDIRFPSDVQQIEEVVAQVVRRCRECRFDGRQLSLNVPVALTEALSNAILRGNCDDARKQVRVRADVSELRLVLEVEDEGEGFDLEACTQDPTSLENLAREDGRGLFLMRSLMDEVERYRGAGNVVRLTLIRR